MLFESRERSNRKSVTVTFADSKEIEINPFGEMSPINTEGVLMSEQECLELDNLEYNELLPKVAFWMKKLDAILDTQTETTIPTPTSRMTMMTTLTRE